MNGTTLRFINTFILLIFCVLGVTGLYGLVWPFPSVLFEIHRIAGWALILLIPWKTAISLRSLRHRMTNRQVSRRIMIGLSLLLSAATLAALVLVLLWTWQIGPYYVWIAGYGYSGIGWHWGIAIGLAPIFLLHVWRRWPRPKRMDFAERRQVLKILGLGGAAIASWRMSAALAESIETEKTPRRFTGSREDGSFAGNAHPVTSGSDQGKVKLDPERWTLRVTGAVVVPLTFMYKDVLSQSTTELTATLDCTGGWYTVQTWQGIPLTELLAQAQMLPDVRGILLKGVLNYSAPFTLEQSQEILLATHVSGEVLNHSHGFPLRAVAPSRRGWHWVKWLTEIEVI